MSAVQKRKPPMAFRDPIFWLLKTLPKGLRNISDCSKMLSTLIIKVQSKNYDDC